MFRYISRDERHAMKKMKSSSLFQNSEKTERWMLTKMGRLTPLLLSSFCITLFFTGFFVYPQNPFKSISERKFLSLQPQIGKVKPNKMFKI